MRHSITYISRLICMICMVFYLAACGKTADTGTVNYEAKPNLSVFAFTDSVPVFRKNGVFWKYGANYNPILKSPIAQDKAEFELYEEKGLVVWTPNVGPLEKTSYAYFEAEKPKSVDVIPFISVSNTLYLVSENESDKLCETVNAPSNDSQKKPEPIQAFVENHAKVSKRLFEYLGDNIKCVTANKTKAGAWMIPLITNQSPEAMGFFFKGQKNEIITLKNFHLGTNINGNESQVIHVQVEKMLDDKLPKKLRLLTHEGQQSIIASQKAGKFDIDRTLLQGGPFRIWVEENKLAVFPTQGEWIDPQNLTGQLFIKQTAEFPIDEEKKNTRSGKTRRVPHKLSVWKGSTGKMKVQEYEGMTFMNNFGKSDRDRFKNNDNNCLRGAIFGGSYVEAAQTKISEKPAILAEAFIGQSLGRCVEFFTYARSIGRAENFINDAKTLITDFDLDFLVFSVSRLELCSQNDEYYNVANGRDLTTPKDWRVIDGKVLAPVPQDLAITFKPDRLAARDAVSKCSYKNDKLLPLEIAPLEKMKQIEKVLKTEKKDVEVLFFDFKDVLAKKYSLARNIKKHCNTFDLKCYTAPQINIYEFKASDKRYSKYLYRYKNDGHPNIRANQHVAKGLTNMVVDVYGVSE